ncbi:MAG: hypothetical protein RR182_01165 [Alistipes sp.]
MIITPDASLIGATQAWSPLTSFIGRKSSAADDLMESLFSNGEKGCYYDPLDLNTLFQDTFGTLPITGSGQPVGLFLDKKNGLTLLDSGVVDQELNNSGAWFNTNTWTVAGGSASAVNVSNGLYQGNRIQAGKLYKATITVDLISGQLYLPYDGYPANSLLVSQSGTYTRYFFGTLSNFYAAFGVSFTGSVRNLSIVQVAGNHAYQTTALSKPQFMGNPSRVVYDGIDDQLVTQFGEILTGCTVARSVPGIGAVFLTGQAIPATYVDSLSHAGLVIINRALSLLETTQLTQILNQRII